MDARDGLPLDYTEGSAQLDPTWMCKNRRSGTPFVQIPAPIPSLSASRDDAEIVLKKTECDGQRGLKISPVRGEVDLCTISRSAAGASKDICVIGPIVGSATIKTAFVLQVRKSGMVQGNGFG